MNLQPLARASVDDCTRNAVSVWRLINIGRDEFVGLWDQVAGIKILTVDHGRHCSRIDFGLRDETFLVAMAAHAVAAVFGRRDRVVSRENRAVVFYPLDLEIDVSLIAR